MSSKPARRALVIGGGAIGRAHALAAAEVLGVENTAIFTRSRATERECTELGVQFFSGALEDAIQKFAPTAYVIATPVDSLAKVTEAILKADGKEIFVEKPAFLTPAEGQAILRLASEKDAKVFVAYNRRFFPAVQTARRMIRDSGEELTTVYAEFTEWGHVIRELKHFSPEVLSRWMIANSLHVIDLMFFPVGLPREKSSAFFYDGTLSWHGHSARMTGSGITASGALFSCWADWEAPGRWGVEWMTPSKRYIFRPMEKLFVQKTGSVALEEIPVPNSGVHKDGFLGQMSAFLGGLGEDLCRLEYALQLVELGEKIAGYSPAKNRE